MRMSLRLTFWLYVMDAAHWAYRRGARAACGPEWCVPVWLGVMDRAYQLYLWALRKASDNTEWE